MCKTEEELQQRAGARGGAHIACVPECPKEKWMRDPGWPHAATVPNQPPIGTRCSYLPSSQRTGEIEYRGRSVWE
jgi:hypothetical protein